MGDRGGGGGGGGGWTVADTAGATLKTKQNKQSNGAPAASATRVLSPQSPKQNQHVRWSKDVLDEGGDRAEKEPPPPPRIDAGIGSKTRSEEDLDKLLDGLTELTETLPGKDLK